jgi:hypothetical protein
VDAGDYIAIYAAVAATAAVGWEVYVWRRSRGTRVEVIANVGFTWGPLGNRRIVTIEVINRSEHPVNVAGVGFRSQTSDTAMHHLTVRPHGATIPGTVAPYHSAMTYSDYDDVVGTGIDFSRPVTAWVRLATNELILSKPRVLRGETLRLPDPEGA